jgi:signal transduction histidine kinase
MGLALADAERVFRGERVTSSEYQFIAKDGTRKVGEVTGVPLILDGEIKAVISVARDISTRKRAIEATIRSSRLEATATLAGGIAHDVNNLMVGVLGYADFLKMELGRRKQPVAYPNAIAMLDCIIRSAERTSELTHQLLAYARGGKYNPKVINLNDTLHEMVQVRTSAMPAAINVEMNLEPNLWRVEADPTQMSQVTTNLFTNAVEAIEGCGQIRITTHNLIAGNPTCPTPPDLKAGPYVCVTIEDTGSGIKEQNLPRIFEPFFTTKFQGRGMGLAATYGIVDNHGGCIAVRSEEGKGAIFEVYLPARQSELIQ